jgi:hypothetical protein
MRETGLRRPDLARLLDVPPSTLHVWLLGDQAPGKSRMTKVLEDFKWIRKAVSDKRLPVDPCLTDIDYREAIQSVRNEYRPAHKLSG